MRHEYKTCQQRRRGYAELRYVLDADEAEVLIRWIDDLTHDEKCWVLQRFEELRDLGYLSGWMSLKLLMQSSWKVWGLLRWMMERYWSEKS